MEGTAWPGAGAVDLWDIHSQVFMETTHRTYVYQASDMGATSRRGLSGSCLCVLPVPWTGGGTLVQRNLKSHLACPSLAGAG